MKLQNLYNMQVDFQKQVLEKQAKGTGKPVMTLPQDDISWFSYHIQAMVEELGEVMKADKRWKTHRNDRFEFNEKLDEIADVFITAMNIAIFSGVSSDQLVDEIIAKIQENEIKLNIKK